MNLHNCHIHTFRDVDVPDRFLPFALVRILRTTYGNKLVTWLLKHLIPFTDNDLLDRYAKFVSIGAKSSQEEIFSGCSLYYPANTKFVVLAMDLTFMKAGRVKRPYIKQLEELSLLATNRGNIFPFIHIDPRRENVLELLKYCVENLGFKGIKIYPNIGYFPYDKRLYPIYDYCIEKGLPVIAHGSPRNSVYFRGSRKELLQLLSNSIIPINTKGKTKKELCSYFSHPLNFERVVKDFPKLKYCIAHFGSEHYWREYINSPGSHDNWLEHIQRIIVENENAYTDVSFTMNSTDLFPLLKILMVDPRIRTKVLFGSDYYMVETKASERMFGLDLRAFLGEDFFKDIAETNPKRFLSTSS
jgi:predicted TIM-barrel fold metal-dependent hydrolase